ncbi:putative ATPase, AAA-type, core, P-loop containing nucleoside triphosphate hydrolase [Septoria linicola]|nr:putative ATPase, AAA-type, core, P-loop containing nucleoside triphosphate hydrolase [Septoria linicola]
MSNTFGGFNAPTVGRHDVFGQTDPRDRFRGFGNMPAEAQFSGFGNVPAESHPRGFGPKSTEAEAEEEAKAQKQDQTQHSTQPKPETSTSPAPHTHYHLFDDVLHLTSAPTADHDLQYLTSLRSAFPSCIITCIPTTNIPLLSFASAGHATALKDLESDSFASWRGYVGPSTQSREGSLAESVHFGKYAYEWRGEEFVVWVVGNVQYVAREREGWEHPLGPSGKVDELIRAVGRWLLDGVVWVYDGYWYQDKKLYQQVQKATWDKVILDEDMKRELTEAAEKFFDSKDVYDDLGVPWKRGLLFHGPPGNGKTISIKALMHTLLNRKHPIPTLYVKAAPMTYNIKQVFGQARSLAPCMLILEDIETIVTPQTRSYFFNEMDGIEDNSGLFVVGSTNYLDKLDPGLTSRPSRFDRKYLFPLPNEHERLLYCQWWRKKVAHNKDIDFPEKLCPAMAKITDDFSFAFLQECFVGSMLFLARQHGKASRSENDKDLDKFELWRVFKKQAEILRKEIRSETASTAWHPVLVGDMRAPPAPQDVGVPFGKAHSLHSGMAELDLGNSKGQGLTNVGSEVADQDQTGTARLYDTKRQYINSAAYETR